MMVFARTTMREEIMVAVAEHKKVEFLYSLVPAYEEH